MLDHIGEGQILLADLAYDSDAQRESLKSQGAWGCIKPVSRRKSPPSFSPFLCRCRNPVECFFSKIEYLRAFASRTHIGFRAA
ncbi:MULTISPECIES: hypothetical protein [Alphaproteobacteria]|uniref:hypothetical protein n=1 Tax=Alphaproteobacteria TaxID=28211 RepID=UPI001AFD57A6|nr:hypothetical protein [Maricaulis sp.]MBO6763770.1 transposase [Maricaulis sp.]